MSAHFRSQRRPARLSSKLFGLAAVFALLAALLYATVLVAPAGAQRQSGPSRRAFAEHLLKLDPGRPLGGDTIVGVSNGDLLLGDPNRINVMLALGSGETIAGGNRSDQLGALGKNATIHGGSGTDVIRGGRGHDTLFGGAGNDLIIDTKGSATIYTGAGKNAVDVAGHPGRDRVLCASGSVDRIHANHGDYIEPTCRKAAGSQVVYNRPAPAAAQRPQVGNAEGCTDNPDVQCTFLAASGTLPGSLWSYQKIPQRECPSSHPYLLLKDYLGFGVSGPFGVEVSNLGNINFFARRVVRSDGYVIGAFGGVVDNWTFNPQEWRMSFHCTSDQSQGYRH
jgi:hypothetical protein